MIYFTVSHVHNYIVVYSLVCGSTRQLQLDNSFIFFLAPSFRTFPFFGCTAQFLDLL